MLRVRWVVVLGAAAVACSAGCGDDDGVATADVGSTATESQESGGSNSAENGSKGDTATDGPTSDDDDVSTSMTADTGSTGSAASSDDASTTTTMPDEPDESFCGAIDDPEACENTYWDDQAYCIWRDVLTVTDDQACREGSHAMRCILGEYQGAGCGAECGPPNYSIIYHREVMPGMHELTASCEIAPAASWSSCQPEFDPACDCGCNLSCDPPYC